MWNEPNSKKLKRIPGIYSTDGTPLQDKLIYLHFFIANSDWYIAEYDGDDLFWGYAVLHGDYVNAEWGYILFSELKEIKIGGLFEVDCETEETWRIRKVSEIEKIKI